VRLDSQGAIMHPSDNLLGTPELDYDRFRDVLREDWGRYSPKGIEPQDFAGRLRSRSLHGFLGMDFTCNANGIERTQLDARLDGIEHYYAAFQVAGGSTVVQNDRIAKVAVGDVVLVDSARPVTFAADDRHRYGQWFCLQLPRRSLVSHLGFEPRGGSRGRGEMQAGRLLHQLVLGAVNDPGSLIAPADAYMRLAVYDLLGALFAPSEAAAVSVHTDRLFARVCSIVRARFADPDIGPCEVAAEAGISLRYLQKLFTARGSTCGRYLSWVRLDHAARLLECRASLKTGQPLSVIACACGFRDYTHFARGFRRRFGRAPGAMGS
jgi:AraC family transcriptional regulator, positive regulator of tynA and feaB